MDSPTGLIGNYIIVIGLLVFAFQFIKGILPGPYRLVERTGKRFVQGAVMTQVKRRGWAHGILVHGVLLMAAFAFAIGILTGTWQAIAIGALLAGLALAVKYLLQLLRRFRAQRRTMPGWRR